MEIKLCQLWLTMLVLVVLVNCVSIVEAGKKKDKGLIIVLSNGGCGGNIVVQTAKDGKKGGGGHKIVVKGGDSGGGCGCSGSCGSCGGGGHDHHHHEVKHIPIPIHIPPGHPIPPPHEMHAAMMSQLTPIVSADEPHKSQSTSQTSDSSNDSSDQDTQASDSSASTSDGSNKGSSSSTNKEDSNMVPLFVPVNAITPPWLHGSPVFVDPSSPIKSMANEYSPARDSNEKGDYGDLATAFNDPMFNLHGMNGQYLPPPPNYPGGPEGAADSDKKDSSAEKTQEGRPGGRNGYLQPLISSVQRLIRGPGPLKDIEQSVVRQRQRIQASFSNLVPVSISNYTSFLPSLPGLRSSTGNRDLKPSGTGPQRSRYLDSLRIRLRPLAPMEGNRLTSTLGSLWRNIRGQPAAGTQSSPSSDQAKNQELMNNKINSNNNLNNLPEMNGQLHPHPLQHQHHHQHPLAQMDPNNAAALHPHHLRLPGQQDNRVMQQYLEQLLTSKWWEWPTGGLLGPNLNQYQSV